MVIKFLSALTLSNLRLVMLGCLSLTIQVYGPGVPLTVLEQELRRAFNCSQGLQSNHRCHNDDFSQLVYLSSTTVNLLKDQIVPLDVTVLRL